MPEPLRSPLEQLRLRTVHEAGHCVVALALGWEVKSVTAGSEAPLSAIAGLLPQEPNMEGIHHIQVSLAGPLAVHIDNDWRPLNNGEDGAASDESHIAMVFDGAPELVGVAEADRGRIREEARLAAIAVLERRWSTVNALALALARESTLDGARVLQIVDQSGD